VDYIVADKMKYLAAKKLNGSDDIRIKNFQKNKAECIDLKDEVYGIKFVKPNSIDYFFSSETLKKQQLEARKRIALRKLHEAQEIQECLDHKRGLPLKYCLRNALVDVKYFVQTRLHKMNDRRLKAAVSLHSSKPVF